MGIAYGLFNSSASAKAIASELPHVRSLVGTPSGLELSLVNVKGAAAHNPTLASLARDAQNAGIKYALTARDPKMSNQAAAGQLTGVFNQAYQSPLYYNGEPFRGEVVYAQGNHYKSMN